MSIRVESKRLGQAMTISRAGSTAVMDATLQPRARVPLHRHADQDETFTILDGHAAFRVGRRRLRLGPGQTTTIPRGVAHSVRTAGSTPLRVRAELTPGEGTEAFFGDLFALGEGGHVTRRGLADPHAALRLARSHGERMPMLPLLPIALQRRVLRALHRPRGRAA